MSFGLALLIICFRLLRFIAISTSFFMSYSVNVLLRSLNITMATFAGSIATSSMDSLVTLNLASLTKSEIIDIDSFRYFGSARVNFMICPHNKQYD